jgi:hypothetical protein
MPGIGLVSSVFERDCCVLQSNTATSKIGQVGGSNVLLVLVSLIGVQKRKSSHADDSTKSSVKPAQPAVKIRVTRKWLIVG